MRHGEWFRIPQVLRRGFAFQPVNWRRRLLWRSNGRGRRRRGVGIPLGVTSIAVQSLKILLGTGLKPAGTNIYDAKSVSESIHAKVTQTE